MGSQDGLEHEHVRDVWQISKNAPAARCNCTNFHPLDNHENMDVRINIPKDDIRELNECQQNVTSAPEVKVVS